MPGKLGATTVTAPPQRVVAYGYLRDTDLAVAIGATLVLAKPNSVFSGGLPPWVKAAAAPALTDSGNALPTEKIASVRPDLILSSDDYQLEADYPTLSRIAPTLGYVTGPGKDSWEVMAQRAGDVLGKRQLADQLVKDVQDKLASVKAAHPEFAGKTFTFGPVGADGQVFTVSSRADAAATFFSQPGLTLSPKVTSLPPSSTPWCPRWRRRCGLNI